MALLKIMTLDVFFELQSLKPCPWLLEKILDMWCFRCGYGIQNQYHRKLFFHSLVEIMELLVTHRKNIIFHVSTNICCIFSNKPYGMSTSLLLMITTCTCSKMVHGVYVVINIPMFFRCSCKKNIFYPINLSYSSKPNISNNLGNRRK